jgi:hypothetical protein
MPTDFKLTHYRSKPIELPYPSGATTQRRPSTRRNTNSQVETRYPNPYTNTNAYLPIEVSHQSMGSSKTCR